jgi:8-amino-7-oxononanoate synthase
MKSLEEKLKDAQNEDFNTIWIVSDGVFSMEGNLAQIDKIVELADQYDARVIIDDAHGIGAIGDGGRGSVSYFGLLDKVDVITATFSKSFASIGGFCVANEDMIDHLFHHARALHFSASIPPSAAAAALKALEIFPTKEGDKLRTQLMNNADNFRKGVKEKVFKTLEGITPVVPIIVGDLIKMFKFNHMLLEEGVYVNPVPPPAVPEATVRTSLMATHTQQDIEEALEILERIARKVRILKKKKK